MDLKTSEALDRLLEIAQGHTGQSRRVANFILAWWNAADLGGFDLSDLFIVDAEISADMVTVVTCLSNSRSVFYPDDRKPQIVRLIAKWRPEIWARSQEEEPAA